MKILLTGNEGFIGKNIEYFSRTRGYEIIGIEKNFNYDDRDLLKSIVSSVDFIFHVGANSSTANHDIHTVMKLNYYSSIKLFDICEELGKKVIFSSSASVYGNDTGLPANLYAWSKMAAENYGIAKCSNFVSLRYFNVYGPKEEDKGCMASVGYQAYANEGKFNLFPGSPARDFVYVDDVVLANFKAIESPSGIYDVGTGNPRTFEDFVKLMKCEYTITSADKIPNWYQFYTKANRENFLPNWFAINSLEDGTEKYLKYLEAQKIG